MLALLQDGRQTPLINAPVQVHQLITDMTENDRVTVYDDLLPRLIPLVLIDEREPLQFRLPQEVGVYLQDVVRDWLLAPDDDVGIAGALQLKAPCLVGIHTIQ